MELSINIHKSPEQNAESYFEKAKKLKRKIPGIKKTIDSYMQKVETLEEDGKKTSAKHPARRDKEWFEKFRWFISSDGYLVIGGRDATTNDMIVKKHTDKNDIVFHTELAGSPFVIIKNPAASHIPEQTIKEAAELCASYSKSWGAARTVADVYHVAPDQLTKEAKAGEYVPKGAFMVYGKRNFMAATLNIAVCNDGRIIAGPVSAIKKYASEHNLPYAELAQGKEKLSDVAKQLRKVIGGELEDIVRVLPQGCMIKRK